MLTPTVIFVTPFVPLDVGHGGNHRSYQIAHDLESALGKEHVVVVSLPLWQQATSQTASPQAQIIRRVQMRLTCYKENLFKLFAYNSYSTKIYTFPRFLAYFQGLVKKVPKPAICIIEHSGLAEVIPINSRHSIPTISSFQNIEAFDWGNPGQDLTTKWGTYARSIDFANEFGVLARCFKRLFISKVEAGLIGGLGLESQHFPYRPVGEIRNRLERIRVERSRVSPEPGLFLLLGSASHFATRKSFEWFIRNAQKTGLPQGVRVILAGSQTEELLKNRPAVPGLELGGQLDQIELDSLMTRIQASLIPQKMGFGALTRLVEMACAGVPVLTSSHSLLAMDRPPGIEVVVDTWEAWQDKMLGINQNDLSTASTLDEYLAWEKSQPQALSELLNGFSDRALQ